MSEFDASLEVMHPDEEGREGRGKKTCNGGGVEGKSEVGDAACGGAQTGGPLEECARARAAASFRPRRWLRRVPH